MISGERPLLPEKFMDTDPRPRLQNANFPSIFARSASAVTDSERSSINTTNKSTRRFPMSLR